MAKELVFIDCGNVAVNATHVKYIQLLSDGTHLVVFDDDTDLNVGKLTPDFMYNICWPDESKYQVL